MSSAEEHSAAINAAITELEGVYAEITALKERVDVELIPSVMAACGEDPSNPSGVNALHSAQLKANKLETASESIGLTIDQLMIYHGSVA